MSDKSNNPALDEIWKLVRETQKNLKDVAASQKLAEKEMRELRASQRKTDLQIQKVGGRFNKRWGHLVEALVEGKLVQLLKERGIQVSQVFPNVKAELKNEDGSTQNTEFDIIAANGREAVAVEVKTVLSKGDVHNFLPNLRKFKFYFPKYKTDILYGAVAYLKSEEGADVLAEKEGLFVIKAVGDSASLINKPDFKPKAFA